MAYGARILADSVSPEGVRLTTMEVTFPRIVLAEFNTHRTFSRNSASSRAIPVEKMLKRVKEDPFIPVYWGKNQKGMQAEEELNESQKDASLKRWLEARDNAVQSVEAMLALGIHKQITNRLLEPFLYHTVIVTATEWDNFFGLRRHKDAQPEIKKIADMMWNVREASEPMSVNYDEWHFPLVEHSEAFDLQVNGMSIGDICKVSAGRCARVSYLTHDGKRDPKADIELCDRLHNSGHMSPMEHVATPMTIEDAQDIVMSQMETCGSFPPDVSTTNVFSGNFRGWKQMRKEMMHESNFLARQKLELLDTTK